MNVCCNSQSIANSAAALLDRCVAVFDSQSRELSQIFKETLSDMSANDRHAFAQYLEMLTTDVNRETRHIPELTLEQKQEIVTNLLNTWNPTELVQAFLAHRNALRQPLNPATENVLKNFTAKLQQLHHGVTVPQLEATVQYGIALKSMTTPESADAASLEGVMPQSATPPSQVAQEVIQDRKAIRRILETESTAMVISSLFESKSQGSMESRMLSLLIARVNRLLLSGQHDAIGMLSAYPENPELLKPGTILAQVFRDTEMAIRSYLQAKALLTFYEHLAASPIFQQRSKAEPLVLTELNEQQTSVTAKLVKARRALGANFNLYLGIKTFLEEVVANPTCGVRCRVGAMQVLASLGVFDIAAVATQVSRAAITSKLQRAINSAAAKDAELNNQYQAFLLEFDNYRFFGSLDTLNLLKSDPELQVARNKATTRRAWYGAAAVVFNSNWFRSLVDLIQKKYKLDRVPLLKNMPFVSSYAQGSRDRQELLFSVGTLIILARTNLPIAVKLAELEAISAYHPAILVTLHRHSIFRSLLEEASKALQEDSSLKFKFQLLAQMIETAAQDPDALRPIDISFEPSRISRLGTALFNTATFAMVTLSFVAPEHAAAIAAYIGNGIWEHVPGAEPLSQSLQTITDQVQATLSDHPEIRSGIQQELSQPLR